MARRQPECAGLEDQTRVGRLALRGMQLGAAHDGEGCVESLRRGRGAAQPTADRARGAAGAMWLHNAGVAGVLAGMACRLTLPAALSREPDSGRPLCMRCGTGAASGDAAAEWAAFAGVLAAWAGAPRAPPPRGPLLRRPSALSSGGGDAEGGRAATPGGSVDSAPGAAWEALLRSPQHRCAPGRERPAARRPGPLWSAAWHACCVCNPCRPRMVKAVTG